MLARETAQPHHRDSVGASAATPAVKGLRAAADPSVAHRVGTPVSEVASMLAEARGRPLHAGARAELEPLVGRGLGDVRVHDDARSARSAESLGAQAYTAGTNIVFGPGRYAPETAAGRGLIAHEVGHVARGHGAGTILRAPKTGDPPHARVLSPPPPRVTEIGSTVVATVYFGHDVTLLDPPSVAALEKLAERLSFMAKPLVSVDGYASTEGPPKRNDELARARRERVVTLLRAKAPKVSYGGVAHGTAEPAIAEDASDPAGLEAQRAQNRRVTVVISDVYLSPPPKIPGPFIGPPHEAVGPDWPKVSHGPKEKSIEDRLDDRLKHVGLSSWERWILVRAAKAGSKAAFAQALGTLGVSDASKDAATAAYGALFEQKF